MDIDTLRRACRLYRIETGYDSTLKVFRGAVGDDVDPYSLGHQAALFKWLRSWQCRQFAVAHHVTSCRSLEAWADQWLAKLPNKEVHLTALSDRQLDQLALAYDALRAQTASVRALPNGRATVTFGPTGAAKTLFALRPLAVPPWDDPIRIKLGYARGNAGDFRRYLVSVSGQLRDLERSTGIRIADLPAAVGRPASSPPKLIDEHNWMVITKGRRP